MVAGFATLPLRAIQAIGNIGGKIWSAIAGGFATVVSNIGNVVTSIFNQWHRLSGLFTFFRDNVINPIRDFFGHVGLALIGAFANVTTAISNVWNTLKGIFKAPIAFLVNVVYDQGIVPVWNFVMGLLGQNSRKLHTLAFNSGGLVPGGGPDKDTVPAMLSPGEFVMSRKSVEYFGRAFFEKVNRNGQSRTPLELKRGGFVNPTNTAMGFTRAQAGKPYDHSGTSRGPGTMDCSMAQSTLIHYIYGQNPWSRIFATGYARSALPNYGFVRGSFGSPNDEKYGYILGVRPTSGSHIGHVIGQIGGMTYESTPPVIRVGAHSYPSSKPDHYYLAGYPQFSFGKKGGTPVSGASSGLLGVISGAAGAVSNFVTNAAGQLIDVVTVLPQIVSKTKDMIGKIVGFPQREGEWSSAGFGVAKVIGKGVIKEVAKDAASLIPGVGPAVGALLNFGGGGIVPGRPGDPRLAILHGGEQVVNPFAAFGTTARGIAPGVGGRWQGTVYPATTSTGAPINVTVHEAGNAEATATRVVNQVIGKVRAR